MYNTVYSACLYSLFINLTPGVNVYEKSKFQIYRMLLICTLFRDATYPLKCKWDASSNLNFFMKRLQSFDRDIQ